MLFSFSGRSPVSGKFPFEVGESRQETGRNMAGFGVDPMHKVSSKHQPKGGQRVTNGKEVPAF